MPVLTTHNLTIGYRHGGNAEALMSGIDVSLCRGRLTALLGSNGIGKSTLLRTISGIQPALEGEVRIDGRSIDTVRRSEMSKLLSIVFTDRTMAGGLTVRELVSLGRQPHTGFLGRLDAHDKEVVEHAVADVGVLNKIDSYVAELSDGERQKVMIAKALAQETPIIVLDEPTAFLDVASRIETLRLLSTLARNSGKAILLSTHDVAPTLLLADELWIIGKERKMQCGCTEDLVLAGALQDMFASERVHFSMDKGDYEVEVPSVSTVRLDCADPLLRRWIVNALRRNAIAVDVAAGLCVEASSAHSIKVGGEEAPSVEKMIELILDK